MRVANRQKCVSLQSYQRSAPRSAAVGDRLSRIMRDRNLAPRLPCLGTPALANPVIIFLCALKVCLASSSPSTFHFVLVNSLHRIITNSHLDWWPKIEAVYCYSGELRFMFSDTLNRVIQGAATHAPLRMTPSLTFKGKISTSLKYKEKATELDTRSYKCLLLALVKLIHADPRLMLHNPVKQAPEMQSSTAELITGLVQLVPLTNTTQLSQEAMEQPSVAVSLRPAMAAHKPVEWVQAVITRFDEQ
ncbi:neurofibromin-like, partial [Notothenia coriiceps]|uniref:Neurofibromin-like n=1 Tax=Notothenia coriiceps TaxID=8208 RepID=A0A6I9NG08_9TELE